MTEEMEEDDDDGETCERCLGKADDVCEDCGDPFCEDHLKDHDCNEKEKGEYDEGEQDDE